MRLWPESLALRLWLALGLSLVAVALLSVLVAVFDDGTDVVLRGRLVGRAADVAADAATRRVRVEVVDDGRVVAERVRFAFPVTPIDGTVLLAHNLHALPPDVAPVVEVLADGSTALRRPAPLARAPGAPQPLSRDGHGAGLVLPAASLADLPAQARGTVLELLRRWLRERPVPPSRFRAADVHMPPRQLQALLRWVP